MNRRMQRHARAAWAAWIAAVLLLCVPASPTHAYKPGKPAQPESQAQPAPAVPKQEPAAPGTQRPASPAGPAVHGPAGPPILPQQPLPFEARCADPNVVLCDPLDDGRVQGVGVTASTPNATLPQALQGRYRDWRWCNRIKGVVPETPSIDHEVKTSGTGSLKFTIPGRSAANAAGSCPIDFTPNNSVQFGEGETFFVQFRVRLSCTLLFTDCDPASPGYKQQPRRFRATDGRFTAFKVSIIGTGDSPQLRAPTDSCTALEVVLVETPSGIIAGYHSCGWYDGHQAGVRCARGTSNCFFDIQPRRGADPYNQGCLNTTGGPQCVRWPADEWVTVTQQITVGKWADKVNDPARSSNIRVWIQHEGQAPELVIDYDRNLRRPEQPFMKYGKIWLLPYMTNKDPKEENPEADMWFDELIVSRGPIAPAQ
jgi:hypothetical protein